MYQIYYFLKEKQEKSCCLLEILSKMSSEWNTFCSNNKFSECWSKNIVKVTIHFLAEVIFNWSLLRNTFQQKLAPSRNQSIEFANWLIGFCIIQVFNEMYFQKDFTTNVEFGVFSYALLWKTSAKDVKHF